MRGSNSKPCTFCGNRVVMRENQQGTLVAINYERNAGQMGLHSCNLSPEQKAERNHFRMGQVIPANGMTNNGTTPVAPTPVEPPTVGTPPVYPNAEPQTPVAPTSVAEGNLNFNEILNGIVKATISEQVTQEMMGKVEGLTEMAKAVATQAALDVTPREHVINITVNGAVVNTMSNRPHKMFERVLKSVARRKHVWICGQAGSGKTTVAGQVAQALDLPYQEVSLGPATSQWDLFGFPSPTGQYVEPATSIRKVYEFGGVLMLDECDNANASVLTAMNSALANGHATFPDARVARHPDFVCIAGANTFGRGADRLYVGRNQIDAATLDRFKFINFDVDEEAELDWAGHDQKEWVLFVQKVRRLATERGLRVVVSPRASINGADELRDGDDWDTLANEYIWNKMASEDVVMLKAALNN